MPSMNSCMWCTYYKDNHCHLIPLHVKSMSPVDVCVKFKFKLQSVKVDKSNG